MNRAVLALLCVLALAGCDAADKQVTKNAKLGPGKHTITKALRGYWKADDAVRGCSWVVQRKSGEVILSGQWSKAVQSQAVILGTGTVGLVFWPSDECGTWRR